MAERNYNGSKIVPVRIPEETLAQIEAIVAKSVDHARGEPFNVSSWIKKAIADKLSHMERSRKPRGQRQPAQAQPIQVDENLTHAASY